MSGPMQMYLYVHDAILREVSELEARARELDRDDAGEIAELSARLIWFKEAVNTHEMTEEQVLFPAMNERFRFVAETYAYDHDDFEIHVFGGIDDALEGLRRSNGGGDRTLHARRLYRQSVALHEHMRLHISKENELLIPKLETEFDIEEQIGLAGAMAGLVQPKMMGELVGFMYRGQALQDRVGMVRFLGNVLAPEVYVDLTSSLQAIDNTAWAEVERALA